MCLAKVMKVNIRLPTRLLFTGEATRIYAVAENGAFGVLPNHTDFVTSLVPSVLILTTVTGEELYFGIDQGLFVKQGHTAEIAVRRGLQGDDLATLSDSIEATFTEVDEEERAARSALSRLEAGIVRRFGDLRKPV